MLHSVGRLFRLKRDNGVRHLPLQHGAGLTVHVLWFAMHGGAPNDLSCLKSLIVMCGMVSITSIPSKLYHSETQASIYNRLHHLSGTTRHHRHSSPPNLAPFPQSHLPRRSNHSNSPPATRTPVGDSENAYALTTAHIRHSCLPAESFRCHVVGCSRVPAAVAP